MWRGLVCFQAGSENNIMLHWTSCYLVQPPPQRQHPLISAPCFWSPSLSWLQQQHSCDTCSWWENVSFPQAHKGTAARCTRQHSGCGFIVNLSVQAKKAAYRYPVSCLSSVNGHFFRNWFCTWVKTLSAMKDPKNLSVLTKLSCCFLFSVINREKSCSAPCNSHIWDRAVVLISSLLLCHSPSCPNPDNHYHINSRFEIHFSFAERYSVQSQMAWLKFHSVLLSHVRLINSALINLN